MGREIKRVSLDFDWPLGKVWEGYVPPPDGRAECTSCSGDGLNQLARVIISTLRTCDQQDAQIIKLLQGLSAVLRRADEEHRMFDFFDSSKIDFHAGFQVLRAINLAAGTTMEEVFYCTSCGGRGTVVVEAEQATFYETWERTEPPAGEGWQVWENVSEGSPLTTVFPTARALCLELRERGTLWSPAMSMEEAEAFVSAGYAPGLLMVGGAVASNERAALLAKKSGA